MPPELVFGEFAPRNERMEGMNLARYSSGVSGRLLLALLISVSTTLRYLTILLAWTVNSGGLEIVALVQILVVCALITALEFVVAWRAVGVSGVELVFVSGQLGAEVSALLSGFVVVLVLGAAGVDSTVLEFAIASIAALALLSSVIAIRRYSMPLAICVLIFSGIPAIALAMEYWTYSLDHLGP